MSSIFSIDKRTKKKEYTCVSHLHCPRPHIYQVPVMTIKIPKLHASLACYFDYIALIDW